MEVSEGKDYRLANVTTTTSLKNLTETDVVKVNGNIVLSANSEELEYMLDTSKVSVVENINQQELAKVAEKIDASFYAIDLVEGQQTIGAIISKDDYGKIKITEVIAEVADELIDGEIIRTDEKKVNKFLGWLSENATLDVDAIYNDFESNTSERITAGVTSSGDVSVLASSVASSFGDVSAYRYLYTAPYEEDNTEYESTADSSRYLLATTKVVLYGYKAKTSGTTTWDSFKAYINVTPHNDLKVHSFNGNLYTPENTRYNVLGATDLKSDSSSSTSRSVSLTLPEAACSVSGALTHTYTYKTGGKKVTNRILFTEYKSRWIAEPISPSKNASHNIKPGMVVKATKGTTTLNQAKASLSYLKLKKAISAYWISDKDIIVNLYYKNHKQIE